MSIFLVWPVPTILPSSVVGLTGCLKIGVHSTPAAVRMDIKAGDYTHNPGVSVSRCRAGHAYLSSLSGVSTVGLNENANPVRRHGFRKQVSLG